VTVPGSKSQTNRAFGARGAGRHRRRCLDDQRCAAQPGYRSDDRSAGSTGPAGRGAGRRGFAGERGTIAPGARHPGRLRPGRHGVLRFVPPLAALGLAAVTFDGDEQARGPADLAVAERACAASVSTSTATACRSGCTAPDRWPAGPWKSTPPRPSQFVSGLLLAGASFTDGLIVQHSGPALPSAPHIAMTVAMLRQAGVDVDSDAQATPDRWQVLPGVVGRRALAHRTGPVQCRPVHRRGGGQRGHGAHHRLAGGQHSTRRGDPGHPSANEFGLSLNRIRISKCADRSPTEDST